MLGTIVATQMHVFYVCLLLTCITNLFYAANDLEERLLTWDIRGMNILAPDDFNVNFFDMHLYAFLWGDDE